MTDRIYESIMLDETGTQGLFEKKTGDLDRCNDATDIYDGWMRGSGWNENIVRKEQLAGLMNEERKH